MNVFLWGLGLFIAAFLSHFTMWKIRMPKRHVKTLLIIFFGALCVGLLLAGLGVLGFAPSGFWEYIHITIFFSSISLAYIATYTALEVDSPSLAMVMQIAGAGREGLEKTAFDKALNDDLLVKPRVRDLLRDKMLILEGDKYRMTPKGYSFIRPFIFYRNILRAPLKGG